MNHQMLHESFNLMKTGQRSSKKPTHGKSRDALKKLHWDIVFKSWDMLKCIFILFYVFLSFKQCEKLTVFLFQFEVIKGQVYLTILKLP